MRGHLNSFQRTMLQWDDLHPYNAVHVISVNGPPDVERLQTVIGARLALLGMTGLVLDRTRGRFEYQGGSTASPITIVPECGDVQQALAAEIRRQLNSRFEAKGSFNPFRFFVAPAGASFWLGLVYFHAVADAEAVVVLLKNLVADYLGWKDPGPAAPLELYPERYDRFFQQPGVCLRRLASLPAFIRNSRRVARPACRDPRDTENGFFLFSVCREGQARLRAAAKSWGVTVNDLFLALLLRALSPLAPRRARTVRRRQLALGSIVNLRKDLGVPSERTFGLFLGSFVVAHEPVADTSLRDLALDVRRQTRVIKERKLYLGTFLELACARFVLRFYSGARRAKFYQKNFPLWGGITNMNLNAIEPRFGRTERVAYLRAVSTGPATPLVLSVTTAGEEMHIGLSYRTAVYSAPEVQAIGGFLSGAPALVGEEP